MDSLNSKEVLNYNSDKVELLDNIVFQYKESIKNFKSKSNLDEETKVLICNSLCGLSNINNCIILIRVLGKLHYILLIEINNKYYILDPNFDKYFNDSNELGFDINVNPRIFMLSNNHGKKFIDDLSEKYYFECTTKNIKLYCDSFVLTNYNNNRPEILYTTKITGEEYLSSMILRRMVDNKGHQKIR